MKTYFSYFAHGETTYFISFKHLQMTSPETSLGREKKDLLLVITCSLTEVFYEIKGR